MGTYEVIMNRAFCMFSPHLFYIFVVLCVHCNSYNFRTLFFEDPNISVVLNFLVAVA